MEPIYQWRTYNKITEMYEDFSEVAHHKSALEKIPE